MINMPPAAAGFEARAGWLVNELEREFGLSASQAAGIVGNLGFESVGFATLQEMKPVKAGSRGGYGWAQWTGERRLAFEHWCAGQGLDVASDEANFGYLLAELRGLEAHALEQTKKTETLESAVFTFGYFFERPLGTTSSHLPGYDDRLHWAKRALAGSVGPQAVPVAAPVVSPAPAAPARAAAPIGTPINTLAATGLGGWLAYFLMAYLKTRGWNTADLGLQGAGYGLCTMFAAVILHYMPWLSSAAGTDPPFKMGVPKMVKGAAAAGLLLLLVGCAAPPNPHQAGDDQRVETKIVRACVASGLFRPVIATGETLLEAAVPIATLPVAVVEAGVHLVCANPHGFGHEISTVEWTVKNLARHKPPG